MDRVGGGKQGYATIGGGGMDGGMDTTLATTPAAAEGTAVEPLVIAGRTFRSRLILGTGKYPDFPTMAAALEHLDQDREFLKRGGVFTDDVIDAYIGLKMQEVTRFRMTTHPVEYDMYYSV